MVEYTTATTKADLSGILALQQVNLSRQLTKEEIESQGFVTVTHSYDELKKLSDIERQIIARDNDTVIAYLLAMTFESRFDIPILAPMFEIFNKIAYAGKKISEYNYIVVGQACVDKQYRGKGILDNCYSAYRNTFKDKYDFAITEIAGSNHRSLSAHKRIGFKEISRYTTEDQTEWYIVLWDWRAI